MNDVSTHPGYAKDVHDCTGELHQQAEELRKLSSSLGKRARRRGITDDDKDLKLHCPVDVYQKFLELVDEKVALEVKIEELHRKRGKLESSRAHYFELYDLAPAGYFTTNDKGVVLEANRATATQLGVDKEALVKQPIANFICGDDQLLYRQTCQQLFATEAPQVVELKMLRMDSTIFWARLSATTGPNVDGKPVCLVVMSDISDHKRLEEELRAREEQHRMVAEFTYDWEFWLGPDETIIYCSPSCQRITGYAAKDFERDPGLLRTLVHPHDLVGYDQHRHGVTSKAQGNYEEIEFRIIHADGSVRWISHACQPVYDATGQYLGTRGSNRDITERRTLESEVLKARNLESIGILAGGIAHDFNNLFQGLLGNISIAKLCTPPSSEAFHFLEKAEMVYAQATKLTEKLVAFSSGGNALRMDLQLATHLREAVTSNLRGSALVAEFDLADDLWLVNVDPGQLCQVMGNMVTNARDAMPSGGRILIAASNEQLLGEKRPNTLSPGNYVRISVQDQGCGISQENLPRIFDPYFSTKERNSQKGMGLGLSLCNTIIQKNGGAITVHSEPGLGTTFTIYLPAVTTASERTAIKRELAGNGPRILILDDEDAVSEVASKYLRHYGYRVDSAANGDAAIAAYQEARLADDPYAAVILDLTIPGGLGGKEVFAILKETDPEVKAIVSSGFVDDPAMTDFASHGFEEVLVKPYQLQSMKEVLERLV